MFDKDSTLKLADGHEYAIADQYIENDVHYVYLVDIDNVNNFIYGKVENNEIVEITDKVLIEKISHKIYKRLTEGEI